VDVRQLSYVLAVVDHGSFTRAAEALHIAQPSLSQGIRALEEELGIELFVRRARPVGLTAAGQALVEPARRAVRDLDTARAAVDAVRGLSGGHLDLVSLPTLSIDPVAGIVGRFRQAHPEVAVRLLEPEDAADVATLVRAGACELGICDLPLPDPRGLLAHHLATQGYQVVLPPERRRRRGTSGEPASTTLSLAEVAELPLVTTPPGTSTRRVVADALAAAGLEARVAVETDHRESLIPLVLAGAGVSVVPDSLVASARSQGAVIARLDRPLTRDVGLIHRDGPLSPAAAAFYALAGLS
jgi:LysR family transcriptional regulator, carnitine catabolism transcriptional activator